MKYLLSILSLSLLLTFAGCDKDETPGGSGNEDLYLLRSIEYPSFSAISNFEYNADNSIKHITTSNGTTGYISSFTYADKKVAQVDISSSMYENKYQYTNGKVSSITYTPTHQSQMGRKLEFSYSNNRVSELRYYNTNEAGTELIYRSIYEYDASGLLKKVVSINGNNKVIWTIEGYSDEISITPWAFIRNSIDELYEIYNLPVLNQMKRMPKKITQSFHLGGQNIATTQKIVESVYTIRNKRLDRIETAIKFPGNPNYDNNSEAIFHY